MFGVSPVPCARHDNPAPCSGLSPELADLRRAEESDTAELFLRPALYPATFADKEAGAGAGAGDLHHAPASPAPDCRLGGHRSYTAAEAADSCQTSQVRDRGLGPELDKNGWPRSPPRWARVTCCGCPRPASRHQTAGTTTGTSTTPTSRPG